MDIYTDSYQDAVEADEMDMLDMYNILTEDDLYVTESDREWNVRTRYFECVDCEGTGFHYYEPQGWWHGSGVFGEEISCGRCDETGEGYENPIGS